MIASSSLLPSEVTGLIFHLDAGEEAYNGAGSSLATDGQTVQEWHDQSSSAVDVIQTTSGFRPIFRTSEINGKPAIDFDGTDDRLIVAGQTPAVLRVTDYSLFVVGKLDTLSINQSFYSTYGLVGGSHSSGNFFSFRSSAADIRLLHGTGSPADASNVLNSNGTIGTSYEKYTAISDQTNEVQKLYIGGTLDDSNTSGQDVGYPTESTLVIGATDFQPMAEFLNGKIAEIIMYDSVISDDDRNGIHDYLSDKYGL